MISKKKLTKSVCCRYCRYYDHGAVFPLCMNLDHGMVRDELKKLDLKYPHCRPSIPTGLHEPTSVCHYFELEPHEHRIYMASNQLTKRDDNSYITELTPEIYESILKQENRGNVAELLFAILIFAIGMLILWLIFGPFITAMCKIFFAIIDFLCN